ncbi:YCII-related [Methylobacterium sp. 4-46]|uniref:YciI family protein n=1 Tax=unclassified Methylobacterium TaxID=2615210 RepID=UPI000152E871|nr:MULTISPECIES: YciI family protein [Methylobacterium]ACA16627.1 YCII-related [Methylobacterium sp. 4-46]WFT82331.1 YciI family protein [Methylobacterium nodulans]
MAYFFCRLIAPRATFPADMTPEEGAAMRAHAAHWRALAEEGRAVAFGPVLDPAGAWGLGLLCVADAQEARAVTEADPVVAAGLGFRTVIHPMPQLSLGRAAAPHPAPAV